MDKLFPTPGSQGTPGVFNFDATFSGTTTDPNHPPKLRGIFLDTDGVPYFILGAAYGDIFLDTDTVPYYVIGNEIVSDTDAVPYFVLGV